MYAAFTLETAFGLAETTKFFPSWLTVGAESSPNGINAGSNHHSLGARRQMAPSKNAIKAVFPLSELGARTRVSAN